MNALFLKDLAAKTHRGIRGRVENGKSGGGLCYGYHVPRYTDGDGEPIRGERTICEAEAEIIRRVFRESAAVRAVQTVHMGGADRGGDVGVSARELALARLGGLPRRWPDRRYSLDR